MKRSLHLLLVFFGSISCIERYYFNPLLLPDTAKHEARNYIAIKGILTKFKEKAQATHTLQELDHAKYHTQNIFKETLPDDVRKDLKIIFAVILNGIYNQYKLPIITSSKSKKTKSDSPLKRLQPKPQQFSVKKTLTIEQLTASMDDITIDTKIPNQLATSMQKIKLDSSPDKPRVTMSELAKSLDNVSFKKK